MKCYLYSIPAIICIFALIGHVTIASANADITVSPKVLLIVGEGSTHDYNARMRAIHGLPLDLTQSDIDRLVGFLRIKVEEDRLPNAQLNAIKNDIVTKILKQRQAYANLSSHLIDGFKGEEMDVVWRDFCLQYLPSCHALSRDRSQQEQIVAVLWETTSIPDETFAGTSLLALRRISNDSPNDVDSYELAERALAVAKDENFSTPSRISALQVAKRHPDAIELSRLLARNNREDSVLRMSAISVLAQSDDSADKAILQELAGSSDVRLRMSARAGLRKPGE